MWLLVRLLFLLLLASPAAAQTDAYLASNGTFKTPFALTNTWTAVQTFNVAPVFGVLPSVPLAQFQILQGNGSGVAAPVTFSAAIDAAVGSTRGSILERAAGGWQIVAPGTTALPWVSNGTGADPAYQALTAAGIAAATITSTQIASGTITGGNIAAGTITGSNIASGTSIALANAATSTPGNILSIANGGANPLVVPQQISPFFIPVATAGAYADSGTGNLFRFSSWISNTGTRPTVAVFGSGRSDSATSFTWGGNFIGYANAVGATAQGVEIDFGNLVAGGNGLGLAVNVSGGNLVTTGMNMTSLGTGSQMITGITFLKANSQQPFQTALIATNSASGTLSATNGIDLSISSSFSGCAFKSPSMCIDGSGSFIGPAVFAPIIVGGSVAASTLTLRSTTGVGTTDAIIFQVGNAGATEAARIFHGGGVSLNSATDPGVGSLFLSQQFFMPNITTSSAAQTGTVCWTTGTGKFTVDTTVGCLTSSERFKNIISYVDSVAALDVVLALRPVTYVKKREFGGDFDSSEQFGLSAEQAASVDERLIARDDERLPKGVRYQQLTAVLAGAVQRLAERIVALEKRIEK